MLFSLTLFLINGAIYCTFLICLILVTKRGVNGYGSKLLGFFLFFISWYTLVYVMLISGTLVYFPVIYKAGMPFYYLAPPMAYLYVRSVLYDETRLAKKDYLHALPALLGLIDMMYYYATTSVQQQQQIAETIVGDPAASLHMANGLVPTVVHYVLRPISGTAYLVAQAVLIRRARMLPGNPVNQFQKVRRWLQLFTRLIAVLYVLMMVIILFGKDFPGQASTEKTAIPMFFSSVAFSFLACYLLLNPGLLYGIPRLRVPAGRREPGAAVDAPHLPAAAVARPSYAAETIAAPLFPAAIPALAAGWATAVTASPVEPSPSLVIGGTPPVAKRKKISDDAVLAVVNKVEAWLAGRSYLRSGITADTLAAELQVPLHHLSFVLNEHYGKRFNDFINMCRIEYCREAILNNVLQEKTLEGLALEAGFASRHTFLAAFKKCTGMTPSEFLKTLQ